MTAEDVRSATRCSHVAQRKLKNTIGTGVVVAIGVLRTTHTPDHSTWTVVRHGACHALELASGRSSHTLNFFRRPFCNFFTDLIHTPNAGADELFVFPTVFEDVPENTPDQSHVRTRTETHIFISMRRCSGETRITNDQRRVVLFFGFQNMEQRYRVRFGRVTTDDKDRFRVMDVIVAVGHGAVAPCICNTCNRC